MTKKEQKSIARGLVEREYLFAVKKHPLFTENMNTAYVVLGEEVGEVAMAIQENDLNNLETELAQVAAVCLRMLEMIMSE